MNNPCHRFVLGTPFAFRADGMQHRYSEERQGKMVPLLCTLLSTFLWQQTLEELITSTPSFYWKERPTSFSHAVWPVWASQYHQGLVGMRCRSRRWEGGNCPQSPLQDFTWGQPCQTDMFLVCRFEGHLAGNRFSTFVLLQTIYLRRAHRPAATVKSGVLPRACRAE